MTWVNTPPKYPKVVEEGEEENAEGNEEDAEPEEEGEGEAENEEDAEKDENGEPIKKPKILYFKESDYHLRVPLEQY